MSTDIGKTCTIEYLEKMARKAFYNVAADVGMSIPKGEDIFLERGFDDFDSEVFRIMRKLVSDSMSVGESVAYGRASK